MKWILVPDRNLRDNMEPTKYTNYRPHKQTGNCVYWQILPSFTNFSETFNKI